MLICPKCNAQLEDGARFCDSCGAPVDQNLNAAPAGQNQSQPDAPQFIYCPSCGSQTSPDNAFCQNCGSPLGTVSGAAEAVSGDKNTKQPKPKKQKAPKENKTKQKPKDTASGGKKSKKWLIFAGIGAAAIATMVCVFILIGGGTGSSAKNYTLYVKDKEIYYSDLSKSDPWQITSRLTDADNLDNPDLASGAGYLSTACRLSQDGSLLFFPDRISMYDSYTLYYRNINKQKEDAVKIDSDIFSYSVSKDASAVTYLKNDTLYQYDRKKNERQKAASDVQRYYVSEDGKTILYMNTENVLYSTVRGGEREKIDSDISSLSYVSEDLSLLFYIKDGTLYKNEIGKDKTKISSDVEYVITSYDSGEVYYVKADSKEVSLMDYVYDDMKEADAALTEPQAPSWSDPDYDAAYEAYEQEYEKYRAKLDRDYFREALAEEKIEQTSYTLCYYDGSEETEISDAFLDYSYISAADKPVLTYLARPESDDAVVKLSEVENVYDISSIITETLYGSVERYVAAGASASLLDQESAQNFHLSPDGSTLYYLDDVREEKNYGDLYQVSISSSGEPGTPELYDSDVCTDVLYFIADEKLLYFKECKNDEGELYINGENIDYDVSTYNIRYDEDADCITYFTDWNAEKGRGTLNVSRKKEPEVIADDVHSYLLLPGGNVLYLCDYSQKHYNGDLYLWNKRKAEKIDDSVVCIIPVY